LPGETVNDDSYRGLGNEYHGNTKAGSGSSVWWFDVGIYINDHNKKTAQGTDHGTSMVDGALFGQYAVYTSDEADSFPCKGADLRVSMYDAEFMGHFDRVDRSSNGFVNFQEFIFYISDIDKDGELSLEEYYNLYSYHFEVPN